MYRGHQRGSISDGDVLGGRGGGGGGGPRA